MSLLEFLAVGSSHLVSNPYVPDNPLGKGKDYTWRSSDRASSLRSRSNRRKAVRRHKL